jgi:hypothetical protein
MTKKTPRRLLFIPALFLILATLACGTGYSTSSKIVGNTGQITVKIKETDGTDQNSVEMNENFFHERVTATVSLVVEVGSCQATLIGEDGTSISLSASAGSPAQASGDLVTDGFGEITLATESQLAQNVEITIDFALK